MPRVTLVPLWVLAVASAACDAKQDPAPSAAAPVAPTATDEAPPAEPEAPPEAVHAQAIAPGAKAELNAPAPDFTLPGVDGAQHKLSDHRGKVVVLEWFNPDCPFIKFAHTQGTLSDMAAKTIGAELVWLSINSGGEGKQGHGLERNKAALGEYAMKNPILLDPDGVVGRAYGAEKTPHMFIVDGEGTLVYRGGIDNAPIGKVDPQRPRYEDSEEGALINYVRGALDDMQGQSPLRLPETPAYGCSVKYTS